MISILIPSYNYNTLPLVEELHNQAILENITFEIIVQDDASSLNEITQTNNKINQITYCRFVRNETTVGRGQNRNSLVAKAQYSWLIFLDCDTFPQHKNFIRNYIEAIKIENIEAVYGGIIYQKQHPNPSEMLRWVYGKKREEIPLKRRLNHPYKHSLMSNFLIKKVIIQKYPFDDKLFQYGYEDVVLIRELQRNAVPIAQIENAAYHLQLEDSVIFLEKTKHSLANLKMLTDQNVFDNANSSLLRTYQLISKMGMRNLVAITFKKTEAFLTKNLLSESPSLLLFLLYKLGYFCQINSR